MGQLTWRSQTSAPLRLTRRRSIPSGRWPPGILPVPLSRSLLLAAVEALVLRIVRLLWWWSAALRLWLSPICAPIIVLLLLLLLCMSISGLRVIIVAIVPAVLLVSVLIIAVIVVLVVLVVVASCILLLSLRRVLRIIILLLLRLARLRAPVVLLLVCHGDAGRVIVYQSSAKPHAPGAFYRGVVLRIAPLCSGDLQPLNQSLDAMSSTPKQPYERVRSVEPGRRKVTARLRGTWQGPEIKERCGRETGRFRWVLLQVKVDRLLPGANVERPSMLCSERRFRRHWCYGCALRREVDASMPSSRWSGTQFRLRGILGALQLNHGQWNHSAGRVLRRGEYL